MDFDFNNIAKNYGTSTTARKNIHIKFITNFVPKFNKPERVIYQKAKEIILKTLFKEKCEESLEDILKDISASRFEHKHIILRLCDIEWFTKASTEELSLLAKEIVQYNWG